MKKLFSPLVVLSLLISLSACDNQNNTENEPLEAEEQMIEDQGMEETMPENSEEEVMGKNTWETYTNEDLKISFSYPGEWKVNEYVYNGKVSAIGLDPLALPTQEDFESLDVPLGLLSFHPETDVTNRVGYQDMEEITISSDNGIKAKVYDENENDNLTPNPAYQNKHVIRYFVSQGDEGVADDWSVDYVSDMDDAHWQSVQEILSSLKFQ